MIAIARLNDVVIMQSTSDRLIVIRVEPVMPEERPPVESKRDAAERACRAFIARTQRRR